MHWISNVKNLHTNIFIAVFPQKIAENRTEFSHISPLDVKIIVFFWRKKMIFSVHQLWGMYLWRAWKQIHFTYLPLKSVHFIWGKYFHSWQLKSAVPKNVVFVNGNKTLLSGLRFFLTLFPYNVNLARKFKKPIVKVFLEPIACYSLLQALLLNPLHHYSPLQAICSSMLFYEIEAWSSMR